MNRKYRILSIDGGGIRGVIVARILSRLEEKLQEQMGDPEYRIGDHFDLIAGTSIGGILACAYLCRENGRQKYSAGEILDYFFERGHDIFQLPLAHRVRTAGGLLDERYPAIALEEMLQYFFSDTALSDLPKPTLITSYDIERRDVHFFKQHRSVDDPGRDFLLRDVGRATSAAPTYFECASIRSRTGESYALIDGGVFANNPTLCAYAEARKLFMKPKRKIKKATARDMAILSVGTGYAKQKYSYELAKNWGKAEWIKPVIDIMMAGVSDTVDYQMKYIFEAENAVKQYLRIDTPLPEAVKPGLDAAGRDNIRALDELGHRVYEENEKAIRRFLKY